MIYGQGGTTTEYNTHYTGTDGYFSMLLASTRPTNKLLALQKDVFDINKVGVVGNPTITSDGVASGFSSYSSGTENYLTFPTVFNPENKPWKIVIKATIGPWISGAQYASLLGSGIQGTDFQSVALALGANQISCWLRSSTGTNWDIGNIRTAFTYTVGETYYFKIEFTGTKYILSVSKDRKNWEIKGSIEKSVPIYVSAQPLVIGDNKYNNVAPTCWNGSIDLMETYVYIGDQVFFTPTKPTYFLERRKPKVWDKNNYSVVGSPIITNDGLATYITGQNYVYIPPIDYTKPFAIRKIGFTRASLGSQNFYFVNGANTANDYGGFTIGFNGTTRKLRLFLGSTGSMWNITNARESVTALEVNTLYYVDLIYSGTNYTCILYDNNLNELERLVVNNSTPLYQSGKGIMIGSNYINATTYNGNIYLSNITVENDGVVVFDGGADTYVYDPSKFTVVGTPNITEYGVVTVTSSTNNCPYIYNIPPLGNNWEIIFPYKANTTTWHSLGTIFREMRTDYQKFSIGSYGTALYIFLRDINNTDLSFNLGTLPQLPFVDMLIKLKCCFENNLYTLRTYVSQNGGDWVALATKTSEVAFFPCENMMNFCIMLNPSDDASINLPSISITVDGVEVFTGAKENYYMLRR